MTIIYFMIPDGTDKTASAYMVAVEGAGGKSKPSV